MTRLTLIVLVFAVLVLSFLTILFITTRKQKYLEAIKKVINYSLSLLIVIVLIFLFLKFVHI
jgi:hypothetical protein